MLKDKIKEYLDNLYNWKIIFSGTKHLFPIDKIAQDIADIVEKDYPTSFVQKENIRLQKENIELKQQIANQRYLQRDEVEKIAKGMFMTNYIYPESDLGIFIDKILSLAIPKVNDDYLIGLFKTYMKKNRIKNNNLVKTVEQIADEITGGE